MGLVDWLKAGDGGTDDGPSLSALEGVTLPELDSGTLAATREAAWEVPAVSQGLQTISGTVGSFPPYQVNANNRRSVPATLAQLDPEEPTTVTLTRLCEDLVLHPAAYLVVLARYEDDGRPRFMRYVPYEQVQPPAENLTSYDRTSASWSLPLMTGAARGRQWRVFDRPTPPEDIVRFRSHWPGLLQVGWRVIRLARTLEGAAERFGNMEQPTGSLKNTGADLPETEVQALLAAWDQAAQTRTTRYLNSALEYQPAGFKAADVDLSTQREHVVAELARLLNLPTQTVNAPSSHSLTYQTLEGQRRNLLDLTLRPYVHAIEDRLSLDDITPRGSDVKLDAEDFTRADTAARYAEYATGVTGGWLTIDEVRDRERVPRLDQLPPFAEDAVPPIPTGRTPT